MNLRRSHYLIKYLFWAKKLWPLWLSIPAALDLAVFRVSAHVMNLDLAQNVMAFFFHFRSFRFFV